MTTFNMWLNVQLLYTKGVSRFEIRSAILMRSVEVSGIRLLLGGGGADAGSREAHPDLVCELKY